MHNRNLYVQALEHNPLCPQDFMLSSNNTTRLDAHPHKTLCPTATTHSKASCTTPQDLMLNSKDTTRLHAQPNKALCTTSAPPKPASYLTSAVLLHSHLVCLPLMLLL
eukprot:scaffold51213_cov21-Tisochrysis_lutea.AAC.1